MMYIEEDILSKKEINIAFAISVFVMSIPVSFFGFVIYEVIYFINSINSY